MFARALIVLLLVLNVGVAAWWALRPAALPPAPVEQPVGVARLRLLSEPPPPSAPAGALPAVAVAPLPGPDPALASTDDARCFAFGPFDDGQAQALVAAQVRRQAGVTSSRIRETQAGSGNGWHVFLPPFADRATAQATAERIVAAGFKDYYIVPDGSGNGVNAIELGRYSTEASALRRRDTLQAAGFAVRVEPLGDVRTQRWIDVVATAGFDVNALRERIDAAQARPLDCATLRQPGRQAR